MDLMDNAPRCPQLAQPQPKHQEILRNIALLPLPIGQVNHSRKCCCTVPGIVRMSMDGTAHGGTQGAGQQRDDRDGVVRTHGRVAPESVAHPGRGKSGKPLWLDEALEASSTSGLPLFDWAEQQVIHLPEGPPIIPRGHDEVGMTCRERRFIALVELDGGEGLATPPAHLD
jgi:hypothetical protein